MSIGLVQVIVILTANASWSLQDCRMKSCCKTANNRDIAYWIILGECSLFFFFQLTTGSSEDSQGQIPLPSGTLDLCHVYARIRELPSSSSPLYRHQPATSLLGADGGIPGGTDMTSIPEVTVCAGRRRERVVYVSDSDRVEITIVTGSRTTNPDPAHFLLRYNGQF